MNTTNFLNPSAVSLLIGGDWGSAEVPKDILSFCDYLVIDSESTLKPEFDDLVQLIRDLKQGCVKSAIVVISRPEKLQVDAVSRLLAANSITDLWMMIKTNLTERDFGLLIETARLLSPDRECKLILDTTALSSLNVLSYSALNANLVRLILIGSENYPARGVLHYSVSTGKYYVSRNIVNQGKEVENGAQRFKEAKRLKMEAGHVHNFSELRTMENVDFRRIHFNSIVVEYTKRCNSACKHCYVSAGPKEDKKLPPSKIVEVLLELVDLERNILPFKRFCIAGGEITLPEYLSEIIEILSFAKKLGFYTEIVTNGYAFSSSTELVEKLIEVVDGLEVSMSPFHIESIGKEHYSTVLPFLRELRLKGKNVIVRYQTTKKLTLQYLYDTFHSQIEGHIIVSSPVSSIGRAEKTIKSADLWFNEVGNLKGGCWRNLNITITSDGFITPCCAGSEITKYLRYGNIFEENVDQIVQRMVEDHYLFILTRYPERLVEHLRQMLPESAGCFCELCVRINSDPKLYKKARKFADAVLKEAMLQ